MQNLPEVKTRHLFFVVHIRKKPVDKYEVVAVELDSYG